MSLIKIDLGLNLKNASVNAVVGKFGALNKSVSKVTDSFSNLKKISLNVINNQLSKTSFSTSLMSLNQGIGILTNKFKSLNSYVTSFVNQGDKIAKTSRLVGLSVHDYQAWSSEAGYAGLSITELDTALQRFNVNVGKAQGGDKTAMKMFEAMLPKNISAYKDNNELLIDLANSYNKLDNATDKAFVSQQLFGRSGLKMSELLGQGGEYLSGRINAFQAPLDDVGAKNAEVLNDTMQAFDESLNLLKFGVAKELFPTFIDFFKTITKYINENGSVLRESIKNVGSQLTEIIKNYLPKIPILLNGVLKVLSFVDEKVVLFGALFAPILPAVLQIGAGLVSILPILGKIALFFGKVLFSKIGLIAAGIASWSYVIYKIYDNFDMLKSFVIDDVWGGIKNAVSSFADFCMGIFKVINEFCIECIVNPIKSIIEMINNALIGGIQKAFSFIGKLPIIGDMFNTNTQNNNQNVAGSIQKVVESSHTTTTNRFAVDFKNMPKGVSVTAPKNGDFDYSRGYILGGI